MRYAALLVALMFSACVSTPPETPRATSPIAAIDMSAGRDWSLAFWLSWQTNQGPSPIPVDAGFVSYPLDVEPGETIERIDVDLSQDFADAQVDAVLWLASAESSSHSFLARSSEIVGAQVWQISFSRETTNLLGAGTIDLPLTIPKGAAAAIAFTGEGHPLALRSIGVVTAFVR